MSRFDAISVRETSGAQVIADMGLAAPQQFLDPVFLLTRENWLKLVPDNMLVTKERYILVYALVEVPKRIDKAIRKYAKVHNCKIKIIPNNYANCQNLFDKPFESGPAEFLALIQNAYCVFTNSFHGAAFSILFNKPVYGFIGDSENARIRSARITDLFRTFGLEERVLTADKIADNRTTIDYSCINQIIDNNRVSAKRYLEEKLKIYNP